MQLRLAHAQGRDERGAARLGRPTSHDTYYCIGTAAGPHPYPAMVRDFQRVIGARDARADAGDRGPPARLRWSPAIGGGSNAMGLFHPFLDDPEVEIVGVEAAGHGLETGEHAAAITGGRPGVLHGNRTYLLQDADGQIIEAHSISAGLDYPGIGPEHSWLHDVGRVELHRRHRRRGARGVPALRPARGHHPGAGARARARRGREARAARWRKDQIMVMNLSGRGDKDIYTVAKPSGERAVSDGRIERALRRAEARGPRGLVTFLTAGDPDLATSLAMLDGLPAAGADLIELGMPFTDPMADGPPIQAAGAAGAEGRHDAAAHARPGARASAPRRRRHADHPDGLLQPDPRLRRRALLQGRRAAGRRRPDHRRPAARGGRGALPAGARARPRLHPPRHADHRRPRLPTRASRTPAASSTTSR